MNRFPVLAKGPRWSMGQHLGRNPGRGFGRVGLIYSAPDAKFFAVPLDAAVDTERFFADTPTP